MERIYNFGAGPAGLAQEVLEEAAGEMLNYQGMGMSIMEASHRSQAYQDVHDETKSLLKELMNLADDREILFLQGGATLQFAMVPLNLLMEEDKASYLLTGSWAKKAYSEAKKFAQVEVLASSEENGFTYIPEIDGTKMSPDSKYLHICTNNTIYGSRIRSEKLEGFDRPLVADMSSNILGESYDYNKFDLFYAGAQKNLGPAGVTIVGIKKDLVGQTRSLPTYLQYKTFIEKDSLYNTPPVYVIYMVGKVAKWLKAQGGVEAIEKINREKAKMLYDFIDNSKVFKNNIAQEDRSLMNVVFVTGDENLDKDFIAGANARGLSGLKGHRSVGGMRASIYNAMPVDGVKALVDYMKEFERENA